MNKPIKINAAQQLRWSLGIEFPLYCEKYNARSVSHTKRGPGRRHELSEEEKLLRRSKRGDRPAVSVKELVWPAKKKVSVSHNWWARRRGKWSLYLHQGVLKMRGFWDGPRRVVVQ